MVAVPPLLAPVFFISFSYCYCDQIPDRSSLKQEGFILSHVFRGVVVCQDRGGIAVEMAVSMVVGAAGSFSQGFSHDV